MDKVFSTLGIVIFLSLIVFMEVSGHHYSPTGIFSNYFAYACSLSAPWQTVVGDLLFIGAIALFVAQVSEYIEVTTTSMIGVGVFIAFAWCFYAGFNFQLPPGA